MTDLRKESFINAITVVFGGPAEAELSRGALQVQRVNRVLEGGIVLSEVPHRHVLEAGADVSAEDPRVQAIAAVAWADPKVVELAEAESVKRGKRIAALEAALEEALSAVATLEAERDALAMALDTAPKADDLAELKAGLAALEQRIPAIVKDAEKRGQI